MRIFKKTTDIQLFLAAQSNRSIGFVPTMGALHQGHLELVKESKKNCDLTVVSIFVNPTQFNNPEDLEKYPRTIESDIRALLAADCEVLFIPEVSEIYPSDYQTTAYPLGNLETVFEGPFRPGHFQGVCQVVDRLFSIVKPQSAFFGQKDYQQCLVISRLLELIPEFSAIKMHLIPTFREPDGLAMSSRNTRLTATGRAAAPVIYHTLVYLKQHIQPGPLDELLGQASQMLRSKGCQPEYVAAADAKTLQPVTNWDGHMPLVILIAAFLDRVRLIDNLIL